MYDDNAAYVKNWVDAIRARIADDGPRKLTFLLVWVIREAGIFWLRLGTFSGLISSKTFRLI